MHSAYIFVYDRFVKRFCAGLFLFIFFIAIPSLVTKNVLAAGLTFISSPSGPIDETVPLIKVTIGNLTPGQTFIFCGAVDRSKDCGIVGGQQFTPTGRDETITICGKGDHLLKYNDCGENDYFYSKKTYGFAISLKENNSYVDKYTIGPIKVYYPVVNVITASPHPQPGDQIQVSIQQDKMRPGGDDRNKYKLVLRTPDGKIYKESNCESITKIKSNPLAVPSDPSDKTLSAGSYKLEVVGCGTNQSDAYASSDVIVDSVNGSISSPNAALEFQEEAPESPSPTPPCLTTELNKCTEVATAIGNIKTDPAGFIDTIFKFLLGISGGIAVVLIIISGYRLMASQGNPEQAQGAREMLTSAIVGLLFIIFSFVILQVIGVDILKIPGFGP